MCHFGADVSGTIWSNIVAKPHVPHRHHHHHHRPHAPPVSRGCRRGPHRPHVVWWSKYSNFHTLFHTKIIISRNNNLCCFYLIFAIVIAFNEKLVSWGWYNRSSYAWHRPYLRLFHRPLPFGFTAGKYRRGFHECIIVWSHSKEGVFSHLSVPAAAFFCTNTKLLRRQYSVLVRDPDY